MYAIWNHHLITVFFFFSVNYLIYLWTLFQRVQSAEWWNHQLLLMIMIATRRRSCQGSHFQCLARAKLLLKVRAESRESISWCPGRISAKALGVRGGCKFFCLIFSLRHTTQLLIKWLFWKLPHTKKKWQLLFCGC